MAKKNIKYKKFNLFTDFDMILFTEIKELNRFLEIKNQSNLILDDCNFIGRTVSFFESDIPYYVMYINTKKYKIGTTIHESTHVVDFLMMDIGINDIEFRAYLIEDLSIKIIEYFKRKLKDG